MSVGRGQKRDWENLGDSTPFCPQSGEQNIWNGGLVFSWVVDWWLLGSGGYGWQALMKCLSQMLIKLILAQVTYGLVTHWSPHKRFLRPRGLSALSSPKVERILQPDFGPSLTSLSYSHLTPLAAPTPLPAFVLLQNLLFLFFAVVLPLTFLSPPKHHFYFLKCGKSKRNAACRERYVAFQITFSSTSYTY